jgi:hypothetical protein
MHSPRRRNQFRRIAVHGAKERVSNMLITMLAAAMTVTMLIATVFGLHQESERVRVRDQRRKLGRFGRHY